MSKAVLKLPPCAREPDESHNAALSHCNAQLEQKTAEQRVLWALEHLPGKPVLSSSFGAQSAVSVHMLSVLSPGIPVIFIDTGYHFAETYRFVDELTNRLGLNLKVYRSQLSPGWQEARHGQRWLQGLPGLNAYDRDNKIEPMQRALKELDAGTWFAGLRRDQAASRREAQLVVSSDDYWKVHPIADWTDRDIYDYLRKHDLPYHPLWEKGYVSIGDKHTTRSLHEVEKLDDTRFFGLKRECGLHDRELFGRDASV